MQMAEEREKLAQIEKRMMMLEAQLAERTAQLEQAMAELRTTQHQLVQQEKLASLGQLTAGIAHEIKNPLNFVTNFASVSTELLNETQDAIRSEISASSEEAVESPPWSYILEDLDSIRSNLEKIHEHGTRADRIVKSMLQHSRAGAAEMAPADLNGIVYEFVNLTYHGMRAGDKRMECDVVYDFDSAVGEIPIIAQDFSRVVINLSSNAFDAMFSKLCELKEKGLQGYRPKLVVRTRREGNSVSLEIEDNGPGIPESIIDQVFQPFFTTKKGTEGTGLGLSISHDIVVAHGAQIQITSSADGTQFNIVGLGAT